MTTVHHPDEAALLATAAGRLPLSAQLVIATHAELCPGCRAAMRTCEAVGGALLEALPPAEMAPDSLALALARLDRPAAPDAVRPPMRALADGVPCPAALRGMPMRGWRWVAPGIRRIRLLAAGDAEGALYLLRIAPGMRMPLHGHGGRELTCVLAGAYEDEFGRFAAGDLVDVDVAEEHQPVAAAGADCICLIAAAAPTRFRGLAARLLQPLVGV